MKSNNTLRNFIAAFIIFCFAESNLLLASHLAGAEISYIHLSGSNYRIRVAYYRDCFGIAAPTSIAVSVASVSCNASTTCIVTQIQNTGQDISLPCAGMQTTCTGGTAPGMEKWEYEGDINLPGQCSDWVFSFSDCCRNAAVTTVQSAAGEAMYIEAHLNNTISDNNSPQFINDPLFIACVNQDFHYNNGMFDPDGDSLVYSLICARNSPNVCATYFPPHTPLQPFISNPPVTFDYFTGDYFMHPTGIEVGMIVYEIRDYRNGELVGSVMRDMMLYTGNCSNQNPTATEMNGTTQQIAYVMPLDTICFDIFSDDIDASDSLTMTWNQVVPAATFNVVNAIHPTGTFCWIPTINDVRSQPYMFTSMIRDEYCPLNNAGVYSYYIYVTLDSSLILLNTVEGDQDLQFSISQNPSAGLFTFQSPQQFSQLKIYNSLGDCILKKKFEKQVELSGQPDGIYFVEAVTPDGKTVRRKLLKESFIIWR